jgi:hypothetical protein
MWMDRDKDSKSTSNHKVAWWLRLGLAGMDVKMR